MVLYLICDCIDLAIAWSGQLGFDTLVFFLTLRKSFEIGRTGHRTLINILLRDGMCQLLLQGI
jgi:hypothetical protein